MRRDFLLATPYTGFTLDGLVATDRGGLLRASVDSARQSSLMAFMITLRVI